jgi:gas vesicle protein
MTTTTKIALGIAGAAAAGLVIGLLIAPEKGTDMRKKIKRKANDWTDSLSSLFVRGKHAVEELESKGRSAKAAAEDKVNRLKESLS